MQGKKKRDADAAERLKQSLADEAAQAEQLATAAASDNAEGGADLLSSKDEDVIF